LCFINDKHYAKRYSLYVSFAALTGGDENMDVVKKIIILIFLSCLFLPGIFAHGSKEYKYNWPYWRGPHQNLVTDEPGFNPHPFSDKDRIIWQSKVGKGYSGVSIQGDYLYTMGYERSSRHDTVYCINLKNGKIKWKHSYKSRHTQYQGPRATPHIDNSRVYTFSISGDLICFEALTGNIIWQRNVVEDFKAKVPTFDFGSSVLITGEMLLLNICKNGIALDKLTGKTMWSSPPEVCGYNTPFIYMKNGEKRAAIFGSDHLYSVKVTTGEVMWSFPFKNKYLVNAADPIIDNRKMFITAGVGNAALLDISDDEPELIWKSTSLQSEYNNYILHNGYLFGNNGDTIGSQAFNLCADFNTGEILWKEKTDIGSTVKIGEYFLFVSMYGEMRIINDNHDKYEEIVYARLPRGDYLSSPVFCRGRLYLRNSRSGEIICMKAD
jgi:outer membrane protein assembly factor BamB